jgi:hypothetical protein
VVAGQANDASRRGRRASSRGRPGGRDPEYRSRTHAEIENAQYVCRAGPGLAAARHPGNGESDPQRRRRPDPRRDQQWCDRRSSRDRAYTVGAGVSDGRDAASRLYAKFSRWRERPYGFLPTRANGRPGVQPDRLFGPRGLRGTGRLPRNDPDSSTDSYISTDTHSSHSSCLKPFGSIDSTGHTWSQLAASRESHSGSGAVVEGCKAMTRSERTGATRGGFLAPATRSGSAFRATLLPVWLLALVCRAAVLVCSSALTCRLPSAVR